MKKLVLTLSIFLFSGCFIYAQKKSDNSTLKGVVTDQDNKAVAHVCVYLLENGSRVDLANTNPEGEYYFHKVKAGTYDIEVDATVQATCNTTHTVKGIQIGKKENLLKDLQITCDPSKPFKGNDKPFRGNKKRGGKRHVETTEQKSNQ